MAVRVSEVRWHGVQSERVRARSKRDENDGRASETEIMERMSGPT